MEQDKELKSLENILSKQQVYKAPAGMSDQVMSAFLAKELALKPAPALIAPWAWISIIGVFLLILGTLSVSSESIPDTSNPYGLAFDVFLNNFIALFASQKPIMTISLAIFAFMMVLSAVVIQKSTIKRLS